MLQLLLRCLTQTVVDHTIHIAGATFIQLFLRDLTITVVTTNFQLVHAVRMFGEESLKLVHQNPGSRLPDVLMHCRADRTDHPAVTVTAANLLTDLFSLRAIPQFVPTLGVQVAHDFFVFGTIARHDIAIRIDEEGVKTHVARKQTLLAVDVVDQTVVKVGTEPLLRAVAAEQFVDQILKVLSHHRAVMDDVLCLNKVKAVMQRSGCELHTHLVRNLVQRNQVRSVFVLDGHAEADILHAHLTQLFQRTVAALIAVLQTTNLVIGLLQTLDRDTDADLRELFAQINDTVSEETVGRNNDTIRLLVQLANDILQVSTDKRLTAGDVGKVHLRKLLDGFNADFFFRLGRCFITVAHRATSVAAISDDDRTIQFLFTIVSHFSNTSISLLSINLHNFLVILIDGIEADVLAVLAVCFAQLLITPEFLNLFLQIFCITALKQLAGLANLNQFRDTTNVCSQHRRAVHLGFHHGERTVLIPLRRVDGEPCFTDEFFQCLTLLESYVLDVLYTTHCFFQRSGTGEDELHIRQFPTDLDECADALFLGEAAKVQRIIHSLILTKGYPPPDKSGRVCCSKPQGRLVQGSDTPLHSYRSLPDCSRVP